MNRALLLLLLIGSVGCQHPALYPLGIYSVSKQDLPIVRAAGFNLVTGPAAKAYLDAAHELHLHVLAAPGMTAGKHFDQTRARHVVAALDRHPALWAWYLSDEPDLNGVSPAELKQTQRVIKEVGARKPTALVICQAADAPSYLPISDIAMVDRYPIPWLPLANFPQQLRLARFAAGPDKRLIAVIQAFDWTYYPQLLPGENNLRSPTYEELRCMTYSALARGANGLFYYCFDDGRWKILQHPDAWERLQRVVEEVNDRLPLFQAKPVWWAEVHEYPERSQRFNEALENSVSTALLQVTHGNAQVVAGIYLLAVNTTATNVTYRTNLPETRAAVQDAPIPVLGEGRTLSKHNGWIEDVFSPFDVHIYGPLY